MLFHGVDMKPGMSCAYGVCRGKIICALSGNPASAITNFYAITAPALKKLAGRRDYELKEIRLCLLDGFKKKSPRTRLLRGKLEIIEDRLSIRLPKAQGNAVLSSTIGCNAIAVIPAGSGPVEAGTILKGFLL